MSGMIRCIFILIAFWCSIQTSFGQEQRIADSLAEIYQRGYHTDQQRMDLLESLSFNEVRDLNLGIQYADEMIRLAVKTGDKNHLRIGYFLKGNKYRLIPQLDAALDAYLKCAEISRELKNARGEGEAYAALGDVYSVAGHFENAYDYYHRAISKLKGQPDIDLSLASVILNTGELFRKHHDYDSALHYFREANSIFEKAGYQTGIGYCLGNIGMVYASLGNTRLAEKNMNQAIAILEKLQDYYPVCDYLVSIAEIFAEKGERNKAIDYALRSLQLAEQVGLKEQISKASLRLSEWYEMEGNERDAFYYYKKHIAYHDSITNLPLVQKMADLRYEYAELQNQGEVNLLNQQKRNQRIMLVSLGIILALAFIILFILYRNNAQRRRAFSILKKQKQETDLQRAKAEDALSELKLTQKQLIQSAKMASLGELTAGIAHEMKNPLNFVNNFSEVSIDLLEELKGNALSKLPDSEKSDAVSILGDLELNLNKILEHGKRADSIVRGMLQHSGHSSGHKDWIDINTLVDEHVRLSYHGLGLREKEFIASIHTAFDPAVGKMEVMPQEIGRVLLNILQNAYYAVMKKKDTLNGAYEPDIRVTTRRTGQRIEIRIRDNGIGIPANILEKIFQPFYTTKPAGQGTGLGLSLSHDIIVAHGGSLKVESVEGAFTEFTILLPLGPVKWVAETAPEDEDVARGAV